MCHVRVDDFGWCVVGLWNQFVVVDENSVSGDVDVEGVYFCY